MSLFARIIPPTSFKLPLLFLVLALLQSGCSINARQFAADAYQNRDPWVDEWIRQWQRESPAEYRSRKTILLATYASSEYRRSNRLGYNAELISRDTPVLLGWLEFKQGDHFAPVYRYVILPLKAITAAELLQQGPWFTHDKSRYFAAKAPAETMNGAMVTDWQFCYDCLSKRPMEKLDPATIASIKKQLDKKTRDLEGLWFVSQPNETLRWRKGDTINVHSGDEALAQQAKLSEQVATQAIAIANARAFDQQYRYFIEHEYEPLTFTGWAQQQGCPSRYFDGNYGHNRNQSREWNARTMIRHNIEYVECHTQALERFSPVPYYAEYQRLKAREKALWARSSKKDRETLVQPEKMMGNATSALEAAAEYIEHGYDILDKIAAEQARKREAEAFSRLTWMNTLNNIKARNDSILQQQQAVNQMLNSMPKSSPGPAQESYSNRHRTNTAGESTNNGNEVNSVSSSANSGESNSSSGQASEVAMTEPARPTKPEQKTNPAEEPNTFIGAGRDYQMTGSSGTYYTRSTAIDLAQTHLRNLAAEFCGSSSRVHINWSAAAVCKQSSHSDEVLCTQDALVNCYQRRCEQEYCGTRNP